LGKVATQTITVAAPYSRTAPIHASVIPRNATKMMFSSKILWENASRASIDVLSLWQTCPYSPFTSNTMASIMSYFSGGSKAPDSDRIILAPSSISPRQNNVANDALIEPDEFKLNGNTTALDHLESIHQIDRKTGEFKPAKKDLSQSSIIDFNNISTLVFKRRFDKFKELLIRWIVYCHIAFFQIENVYFRELLFYVFPGLTTLLPKARLVIRRWIKEAFNARKERLRLEMAEAHSNISISFDLWTSPNYRSILGC